MLNNCKIFIVTLLTLTLTACGFHPEGKAELAPAIHRVYIQTSDPYSILTRSLTSSLKMSNVQVVSSSIQADVILAILSDTTSQQLISVGGTQQTRQYNLIATVTFELTDTKGRMIMPPQALSESRVITVQSNQILGSNNEATLFYQQMHRALAYDIMNRISSTQVTQMVNEAFAPTSHVKTS